MNSRWLTRKTDISSAEKDDLMRSLLTSDGMGKEFKKEVLLELLKREKSWVSPTERIPEEHRVILVLTKWNTYHLVYTSEGKWYRDSNDERMWIEHIVGWQFLPKGGDDFR